MDHTQQEPPPCDGRAGIEERHRIQRADFWALTAAIALVGLAMGAVLPLSAARLTAWGLGPAAVGAVMALYAVGSVLAMPLVERIVPRFGARAALRGLLLCSAVWCAALEGADGPAAWGVGLFGLGILLGGVFNIVEAWIQLTLADERRGRWVAIHCTVFTGLQLTGPLLLSIGPRTGTFLWMASLLVLGLPCLSALRDASFTDGAAVADVRWWRLLGDQPGIAVSVALFAIFDAVVLVLLPLYAELGGLSTRLGLLSASVALAGDTMLEWAVGALADAIGRRRTQWICAAVLLVLAPAMPLALGTWAWWPLLFVVGGAAGGLYVLAMVACGQSYVGARLLKVTALMGSVWGAASIAGPIATGALMSAIGRWSIPLLLVALALMLMTALAADRRRHRIDPTHQAPEHDDAPQAA